MNSLIVFLRQLFRAYSDGLRHAGYPETYSGRYLTRADGPELAKIPDDHVRLVEVPLEARIRLG